jgi:HAD superfamily hydrolase (TIGR01509 family)
MRGVKKPGLVIFDCDGVLVDSEPASERVFAEMAAELGIEISVAEVGRRYLGRSDDYAFKDLAARHGIELPRDFFQRLEQAKLVAYRSGVEVIPGAVHAVKRVVKAGLATCVATSGTPEETKTKFANTALAELIGDRVYTASMVTRGKPAPDLFLHAAEQMGVAPGMCVVVEDSAAGVQGAMEAQMRVLGFAPKGDVLGLSDLGAEVFPSMADVPSLLGI